VEIGSMTLARPGSENRWLGAVPWTGLVVALGLWLRFYHYLRDPSMWHDEAALTLNVLRNGFTSLLGPLLFAEAAPPLFLWVEKLVTLILDDGTYALRLVPFLASCASLVLLVPIARRLLRPRAVPWAVLLFAFSDNLLWHACEAKPYAVEVFCAVALLGVYCGARDWSLGWQLVLYSAIAPALIFLAYPGCFLCGGLLMALLPAVWRARRARLVLGYGLLTLVIGVSFLALLLGPIHAQRCPEMTSCWEDQFAPWEHLGKVPVWALASLLEVGRYCCRPTGQLLLGLAVVGGVLFWRREQRAVLALLTVPIGLAFVAALIRAYPFGGTRVMAYAAPALVLLMGEGALFVMAWLGTRARVAVVPLVAVLMAPVGYAVYHVVFPWERADCYGASAYVLAQRRPSDAVAGNHWEYLYYFRSLGPALVDLWEPPAQPGARLWLVTSGADEAHRRQMARVVPGSWQVLEQREFTRTSVFLLQRSAAAVTAPARDGQ
jgi:hypothetical protein